MPDQHPPLSPAELERRRGLAREIFGSRVERVSLTPERAEEVIYDAAADLQASGAEALAMVEAAGPGPADKQEAQAVVQQADHRTEEAVDRAEARIPQSIPSVWESPDSMSTFGSVVHRKRRAEQAPPPPPPAPVSPPIAPAERIVPPEPLPSLPKPVARPPEPALPPPEPAPSPARPAIPTSLDSLFGSPSSNDTLFGVDSASFDAPDPFLSGAPPEVRDHIDLVQGPDDEEEPEPIIHRVSRAELQGRGISRADLINSFGLFRRRGRASINLLKKELKMDPVKATEIVAFLEDHRLISTPEESGTRRVLVDRPVHFALESPPAKTERREREERGPRQRRERPQPERPPQAEPVVVPLPVRTSARPPERPQAEPPRLEPVAPPPAPSRPVARPLDPDVLPIFRSPPEPPPLPSAPARPGTVIDRVRAAQERTDQARREGRDQSSDSFLPAPPPVERDRRPVIEDDEEPPRPRRQRYKIEDESDLGAISRPKSATASSLDSRRSGTARPSSPSSPESTGSSWMASLRAASQPDRASPHQPPSRRPEPPPPPPRQETGRRTPPQRVDDVVDDGWDKPPPLPASRDGRFDDISFRSPRPPAVREDSPRSLDPEAARGRLFRETSIPESTLVELSSALDQENPHARQLIDALESVIRQINPIRNAYLERRRRDNDSQRDEQFIRATQAERDLFNEIFSSIERNSQGTDEQARVYRAIAVLKKESGRVIAAYAPFREP